MIFSKRLAIELTLMLLPSQVAFGESQLVRAELPYRGEPIAQWIEVIEQGRDRSIVAQVTKTPKKLDVSTYVDDADPHALVSGVVLLADGEVISSPLREISATVGRGEEASLQVAQQTADSFESQIKTDRAEVARLEAEQETKTRALRQAAGLGEVDTQLQKAAALQTKINAFKEAIKDLADKATQPVADSAAVP
jgi:regulator of protease activity HflC (stomatin/prohibitin superfamily)